MLYISKKFDAFYAGLSEEDKLKADKIVLTLCDDHEKYMQRVESEMMELLQQAIEAAAALDLEKLAAIKAATEKKKNYITIERYIEISFGL